MKTSKALFRAVMWLMAVVCLAGTLMFASFAAQTVGTVKVKQSEKTTATVSITWTVSGSVSGVEVLRYNSKTKQYDSLGKTTKKTYKFKGLNPGADYKVALRPYLKSAGTTKNGKLKKFRVYTGIAAVAKISQTEVAENTHKLSWKKVAGAEKYEVYHYVANEKKFNLLGETPNTYVRLSNLKPATLYQYRVRAVSVARDGKRVNAPVSKTFTAYTIPGAVKNFKVTDVSTSGYCLKWDAVQNASGYIVSRFDEATGQYQELAKTPVASYVVREMEPGTTEYYRVCAYATLLKVNRCGEETATQVVSTKPDTVSPKYLSGDPMRGKLRIGWTPNEKCDGYRLFATQTEGKDYKLLLEVPKSGTKSAVILLPEACKKTYVYIQTYIVTDNGRVYSDYSPALTVSTQTQSATAAQTTTKTTKST